MVKNLEVKHSLRNANTLGFDAQAEYYIELGCLEKLTQLLGYVTSNELPLLMLGGGSNLVLSHSIPGVVAKLVNKQIKVVSEDSSSVTIDVDAGCDWHELVEYSLSKGWYGLERLALIPGTVGAAPIQNIGAYGSELKDNLHSLMAVNRKDGKITVFSREDCQFGYRQSVFKNEFFDQFVIWQLRFVLSKVDKSMEGGYKALSSYFVEHGIENPNALDQFQAVCDIRRAKLPDPSVLGNVGSFFHNPVVSASLYNDIKSKFPDVVSFEEPSGMKKLAAAWLIDKAGWKGFRAQDIGVYDKQALVLVNHGEGTRDQLLVLANEIQQSVKAMFGVSLCIEPRVYPCN